MTSYIFLGYIPVVILLAFGGVFMESSNSQVRMVPERIMMFETAKSFMIAGIVVLIITSMAVILFNIPVQECIGGRLYSHTLASDPTPILIEGIGMIDCVAGADSAK